MPLFLVMKNEICRFCQTLLPLPQMFKIANRSISLYECVNCGLIQTPENKTDYTSGNLISYYNERREWINNRHKYIFDTIENLLQKKNNIKFLDIGCGIGFSLVEAQKRNWAGIGIEPNKDLAQYAIDHLKVKVINSYFTKETLPYEKFDFILIDNVIEHLCDPVSMIKTAITQLESDGIILVAVPPVDTLRRNLVKSKYIREKVSSATINMFNDTYEHINFISRSSVKNLANTIGLQLIDINFHHHKKFELVQKILALESGYYFLKRTNYSEYGSSI